MYRLPFFEFLEERKDIKKTHGFVRLQREIKMDLDSNNVYQVIEMEEERHLVTHRKDLLPQKNDTFHDQKVYRCIATLKERLLELEDA